MAPRWRRRGRRILDAAFGSASPLVLARLGSALLTFALPLALARILDARAFGAYKQFFLVVMTLLLVGQCGLTQSLYYFLPRCDRARGTYVAQAVGLVWALAALVGGAVIAGAPALERFIGAGALRPLGAPLAVTAALMLASTPLESALTASGRIRWSALAYVASDGARAAALLGAARWGGPAAMFWASAAVAGLRVAALAALLARRVLPLAWPSAALLRAQLRYALPFAGAGVFFVGQRYCAQYLVAARVDTATFPIFSIGAFHLPVVDIVFTPVTEVLMVALGGTLTRDPGASLAAVRNAGNRLAALLFPAAAGAWLLGATLVPLFFTARYAAAVPLFEIATLLVPFCILPSDALLRAAGDTRFLFVFSAARVPFTLALVLVGMRYGWLAGAMLGAVAAEAVARVAMLWRGRRFVGHPRLAAMLDLSVLGRIGAASAAACVPAWCVRLVVRAPLAMVLVTIAVYLAAYFTLERRLVVVK